jgi:hypothetical protein
MKNGDFYEGSFLENEFDGHGKYVYSENDGLRRASYDGSWKNGKKHGYGTFIWKNGVTFEGQYVDDERIGFGSMNFPANDPFNRLRYVGDWKRGQLNGHGTLTYTNGDVYEGDFVAGAVRGNGTFFFADGRKYVGQVLKGKSHGRGVMYYNSKTSGEIR